MDSNKVRKIHLGADHRGFELKKNLIPLIKEQLKIEVKDHGAYEYTQQDDYVDYAKNVSVAINKNPETDIGILICGSGIGMNIIANHSNNIRAAQVNNSKEAELDRWEHNSNLLIIGSDNFTNAPEILELFKIWLNAETAPDGRHKRRQNKIQLIKSNPPDPMIVPAILDQDIQKVKKQTLNFTKIAPLINIDFIDNSLVKGKTIKFTEVLEVIQENPVQLFSLHLMVNKNIKYIQELISKNITNILYVYCHVESEDFFEGEGLIEKNEINFEIIPTINPNTTINFEQLSRFLRIQLMSVNPGEQGREFEEAIIKERFDQLTRLGPRYLNRIHLDGGINNSSINILKPFFDYIEILNVGSALSESDDAQESYNKLVNTHT